MASQVRNSWALGGAVFGATMMVIIGLFQALIGVAALAQNQIFVQNAGYIYDVDLTSWGWAHLVLGALMVITGCCIFTGATWARAVGIGFAVLSAVANFLFLPYYPLWALVVIALDVFVIWSLATMSTPARESRPATESSSGTQTGRGQRTAHPDWSEVNESRRPGDNRTMYPGATVDDTGQSASQRTTPPNRDA